jgi:hypothetical protein
MEKYVDKLLKAKIVRQSRSPWNSPAILIRKKGFNPEKADEISSWRLVIDYRKLNKRLLPEFQPLGGLDHASYLMAKVMQQGQTQKTENDQNSQNSKIMISSFDLTASYYQTQLTDRTSQYTAFSTRTSHVEFTKLPMGISQSPSSFCRALYRVFANEIASHSMSLYIDDAIIANADFPSHLTQLRDIFRKLRAHNLRINPQKSLFAKESVTFLGFVFSAEGMNIDPKRFQRIAELKPPTNQKETRQLTGFLMYYRKHVPGFSKIIEPIRQLLSKDQPFHWTTEHDQALEQLKKLLLQNATLVYPDFDKPFVIFCDASGHSVGHVLAQEKQGVLRPLAFGGRSMRSYEQKSSACHAELIALLDAIKTYHPYLSNGRPFVVHSDHCSLKYIQSLKLSSNPKLIRFSLLLQHFNFSIQHISGASNVVADFLSRYPSIHSCQEQQPVDESREANQSQDFLPDLDFYDYLASLDVEAYNADSEIQFRDPSRKRRRNYKTFQFMPIDVIQQSAANAPQQKTVAQKRKQRTTPHNNASNEQQAVTHDEVNGSDDDESIITEAELNERQTQIQSQLTPAVNLQSQRDDPFFHAIIEHLQTGALPNDRTLAQRILFQIDDFYIEDDQLWHLARIRGKNLEKIVPRYQQLCIPKSFRLKLMESIHNISHFSFLKCYLTARQKFYWPGMATEMNIYTKSCLVCQQIKSSPKPHYPMKGIPAKGLFQCLQIDYHEIRTPKRETPGEYRYVLVAIDNYSHYVTLLPTKDMTAETSAKLIMDNIILKYGTFRYLISDRSTSWLNQLFAAFLKLPGFDTHHIKTSPYRPQTNSLSELTNKHLIRHLRAYCSDPKQFAQYLPAIAAAVNAIVIENLGVSPYFLLYGMNYRFPFETALTTNEQEVRSYDHPGLRALAHRMKIVREIVAQNIRDAKKNMERVRNVGAKPHTFQEGDRVFVASQLDRNRATNEKHGRQFSGPYILVQLKDSLARLQHVYTGRLLPSFINVDKLRHLKDVDRNVLYNRYLKQSPTDDSEEVNIPEQRTIQCVNTPSGHWSHRRLVNNSQLLHAPASTYTPVDSLNVNEVEHEPDACGLRLGANGNRSSQLTQLCISDGIITKQTPMHTDNKLTLSSLVDDTEDACCRCTEQMALTKRSYSDAATETDASHLLDYTSTEEPFIKSCNRAVQLNQNEQLKLREQTSSITHDCREPFAKVMPAGPKLNLASTDCTTLTGVLAKQSHIQTAVNGTLEPVNTYENRTETTEQSSPLLRHNELQLQNRDDLPLESLHNEIADVSLNRRDAQITPAEPDEMLDSDTTALSRSLEPDTTMHSDELEQVEMDAKDVVEQSQQSQEDTLPRSYKAISLSPQGNCYNAKVIKVSARKSAKPQPLYKAHFSDGSQKQWLPASEIPPDILAKFFVEHYARSQKRKLAAKTPSKKGAKSTQTCTTM